MQKPKYVTTTIEGVKVTLPLFDEKFITAGMRRKTRALPEDRLTEEVIWLYLEEYLTEKQLNAADSLPITTLIEAISEQQGEDLPKE